MSIICTYQIQTTIKICKILKLLSKWTWYNNLLTIEVNNADEESEDDSMALVVLHRQLPNQATSVPSIFFIETI